MSKEMYFTSGAEARHTVWHLALKAGTDELQGIMAVDLNFNDFELIAKLLSTDRVGAKPVDLDGRQYLLMYDNNMQRPYDSIMIWRYEAIGNENVIVDMRQEDYSVIAYAWSNFLL